MFSRIMIPKHTIKPLELVVSAIHCLKDKKGSSPQNIIRYLQGKYHENSEGLKLQVQAGLKRGLNFGLITQEAGLYRLNDILNSPLKQSEVGSGDIPTLKGRKKKHRKTRTRRNSKPSSIKRKRRQTAVRCRNGLQRLKKTPKLNKIKTQPKKNVCSGDGPRLGKIKQQKPKRKKEKLKGVRVPKGGETQPVKTENPGKHRPTVSTKKQRTGKLMKTLKNTLFSIKNAMPNFVPENVVESQPNSC